MMANLMLPKGRKPMTDGDLAALTRLLAKVEAGRVEGPNFMDVCVALGFKQEFVYTWKAAQESLDAAKALHEAVLPEWDHGHDGSIAWVKQKDKRTSYRHDAQNGFTARAWLIAIIKALIAEETQ